jgi:hypothetical protein
VTKQEAEFEIVPAKPSEPAEPTFIRRSIGRRNVIAAVTGMGLAGAFGIRQTLAQDEVENEDDEDGAAFEHPEFSEQYRNFVTKLARALGETDPEVVDTAIRDALKAIVDEQFDAGEISRNLATEIKARIDASDAPLGVAMLGAMRMRRMERRRNRRKDRDADERDGMDGGASESEDTGATTDVATPTP